jgi:UDP-N-acetylmuramoyl-tripeptide--D-alanyl-D-alanine ligase
VALRTEKRDGHAFLATAAAAGARAALVECFNPEVIVPQLVVSEDGGGVLGALQRIAASHRLRFQAPVLGVTGSAGKTSTKDLLAAMLGPSGFATDGNLNNFLGVPLMLLKASPGRHRAGVVIEAGMSLPGEMDALARTIQPDVGIVTNVLPAHLEGVGTLEDVAREKAALLRHVRPGGAVVFPAPLLGYAAFRDLPARSFPVEFQGIAGPGGVGREGRGGASFAAGQAGKDIRAGIVRAGLSPVPDGGGTHIRLALQPLSREAGTLDFLIPECPEGMVRNAVLAAVAAVLAGVPLGNIRAAMASWRPSARRGEIVMRDGRLFYVDCYNANPASMLDAARAFDRRTEGDPSRVLVLGGMNELGPQSAALHRETGAALPLRAGDSLVLFGGDAPDLGEGAARNGFPRQSIHVAKDIETVRALVAAFPGPVFLKGSRGRALERVLA